MNRFWSKVYKSPDCWIWQAGKLKDGYGSFKYNGRTKQAHRMAWELINGEIPEGLKVLHKCDNPPCCNPNHLFLGTDLENNRDMMKKRRNRFTGPTPGEKHHNAKLTALNIEEIKARYATGEPQYRIAESYNVRQGHISRIITGKQRKTG